MTGSGLMYAGTFPKLDRSGRAGPESGIYRFRLDPETGQLDPAGMTAAARPGWIAAHPRQPYLYAVNEVHEFEGRAGGGVSAFAIDPASGELIALNTKPAGAGLPCHCVVDQTGRFLLVSTLLEGTVRLFPIEADGRIGAACDGHRHQGASIHPRRQAQAHAHSVTVDPANRFALAADLGADRVVVYELDPQQGRLIPRPASDARVTPGSGPRHIAFHPSAPFLYLISEMAATVTAFAYQPTTGQPREIQTVSTLPAGFTGFRSAAEIAIHPSGRFLYATNRSYGSSGEPPERGEDSIVWFGIDPGDGRLIRGGRAHTGGETPRNLVIEPGGGRLYVANQRSNNITAFSVDRETGALSPTGQVVSAPAPACLQVLTHGF